MNNFPYPVLTEYDSSYEDEIKFILQYIDSQVIDEIIKLNFNLSLNSKSLMGLIKEQYAKLVVKVTTEMYSKTIDVSTENGNVQLDLPIDLIKSSDSIDVVAMVVAEKDFELVDNDEIKRIYGSGYVVSIKRSYILGISNTEKLDYSTSNDEFIKFRISDEQDGKGFRVKLKGENFIEIVVGQRFNTAYAKIKKDGRINRIFTSHIVFETFVYTLIELTQNRENYEETEWYKSFERMIKNNGEESLEQFVEKACDDGIINLELIYDMANKLINNQIENSLISISTIGE